MSLRMGQIQLAAFAHAHGLGLDAAAALLRRQVQETRRYSACLRDVGADG